MQISGNVVVHASTVTAPITARFALKQSTTTSQCIQLHPARMDTLTLTTVICIHV